ncbi:hypothetical protein [Streptomyces sp. bgisy100]|uniref:hypothetical protein n=1 Tax=Streptomyces sp. bgisy100 TaxID=3413783 RepID=UPI003D741360
MSSQAQERPGRAVADLPFETGTLEMLPDKGISFPELQELELEPRISHMLGLGQDVTHTVRALSKTMTFQGKLFTAAHAPIATLENVTVTATQASDPHTGVPFVHVTLDYFATSHGFRTGRGAPGEPLGAPQGLYFRNQAGGTVYSWGFPNDDFRLECGWERRHCFHHFYDKTFVGWFDVWEGILHEVRGVFFRC